MTDHINWQFQRYWYFARKSSRD